MLNFLALQAPAINRTYSGIAKANTGSAWITTQLLVILTLFALLSFVGRRGWLKPWETGVLGGAMIFAAGAWLVQTASVVTINAYGPTPKALWTAVALIFPVVLALGVSLAVLVRRMIKGPPQAPQKTIAPSISNGPAPKPSAKAPRRRY